MGTHVVPGATFPPTLDLRLLGTLGDDRYSAAVRIDADRHAVLPADEVVAVALEAAPHQLVGEQAGHLPRGQHFEDFELGADPVLGLDDPVDGLTNADAVRSAHGGLPKTRGSKSEKTSVISPPAGALSSDFSILTWIAAGGGVRTHGVDLAC